MSCPILGLPTLGRQFLQASVARGEGAREEQLLNGCNRLHPRLGHCQVVLPIFKIQVPDEASNYEGDRF